MTDGKPKKRLVSFADIAARQASGPAAPKPVEPVAAEPEKRVTYADLAALSKRPEDFGPLSCAPESGIPTSGTPEAGIPFPRTPAPAARAAEAGVPASAIPVQAPPAPIPVVSSVIVSGVIFPGATASSAAVIGTPVSGTPDRTVPVPVVPRPPARTPGPQIRYALRARDGHSPGEHAVYQALWSSGEPYTENSRVVTLGYRALSRLCGLTVNNCKANLRGLAAKLAVEEAGGHTYTQAKTYIVYGEAAVLQRRKAAGLTHYIKSRGVVFVDPETGMEPGIPETAVPARATGIPEPGVPD